ncbi:cell division cycle- protein [Malassezia cuniculi]|uniref:Cell division cycle- protein n=1 Tax=Malassezia cuniculi TaxID=948313 RepID=A0AAF0EXJ2_9BASI|nr:cell division cycle- protein [Malassezia cuniculi]
MPLDGRVEPLHVMLVEEDGYYESFYVRAICDYHSNEQNMLSFDKGAIIQVLSQMESGWWDGVIGQNTRGWFPSNHVELVTDSEAIAATSSAPCISIASYVDAAQESLHSLLSLVRSTVPINTQVNQGNDSMVSLYVQQTSNVVHAAHELLRIVHHGRSPTQCNTYTQVLVREAADTLSFIVLLVRELSKKLHWSPEFDQSYQELCLAYTSEQQTLAHHASRLHDIFEAFSPETRVPQKAEALQTLPKLNLSATHINILAGSASSGHKASVDDVKALLVQVCGSFEPVYSVLDGNAMLQRGDAWVASMRVILELFCKASHGLSSCELDASLQALARREAPQNIVDPIKKAYNGCLAAHNKALYAAQALYLMAQSALLFATRRPGDASLPPSLLPVTRTFEEQVQTLQAAFTSYLDLVRLPSTPEGKGALSNFSTPSVRISVPSTGTTLSGAGTPERDSSASINHVPVLHCEQMPTFLGCDIASEDIVYSDTGVKGGTLPALVAYLTKHDAYDSTFTNTFLTTFKTFTTTDVFLQLVIERYRISPPQGLSPEQQTVWTERKQRPIRLRSFNIIKVWLESHFATGQDEEFLYLVERFADTDLADEVSQRKCELIKRLVYRRFRDLPVMARVQSNPARAPIPVLPRNLRRIEILDIEPIEWARQLTVHESRLFNKISPLECLSKTWTGAEASKRAQGILGTIAFYNKITSWVQCSLLAQKGMRVRSQMLKHFVLIASKCLELNNFASMWSIICALNLTSVNRLRNTWQQAGDQIKLKFDHMDQIVKMDRNYAVYREVLHKVNPPCVPFFGVYAKDLTFIYDGNPDVLQGDPKMINFSKRQRIAEIIREISGFQSAYNLTEVPAISDYFRKNLVFGMSDHECYAKSLKLEPRLEDVYLEEQRLSQVLRENGFL